MLNIYQYLQFSLPQWEDTIPIYARSSQDEDSNIHQFFP